MPADTLTMPADALTMQVDALTMQADALTRRPTRWHCWVLQNLIRYKLMKCCT